MWSTKRKPDLADDLDILLGDLCREWGFCNRLSGRDLVASGSTLDAVAFANAVLRAEGMNPEYEPTWVRRMGEQFFRRYGPSVSQQSFVPRDI